ncbi:MAG: hypothetical protein WAL67_02610 [Candidatus Cybelea sp.]
MPLQTGTWKINAGGTVGQLVITSVDGLGNVTGSLTSGFAGIKSVSIAGIWDEVAQRLMLVVNTLLSGAQTYTGFLFKDSLRMPGVTGSVVFTLVGSFQVFSLPATTDQFEFGWYAQIGVP